MNRLTLIAAAALAALISSSAAADSFGVRIVDSGVSIGFGFSTPLAPVEVIPAPRPGYAWVPGYWAWDGYRHAWVQGRWAAAAPPAVIYSYPIAPVAPAWGFVVQEPQRHFHQGRGQWNQGHRQWNQGHQWDQGRRQFDQRPHSGRRDR